MGICSTNVHIRGVSDSDTNKWGVKIKIVDKEYTIQNILNFQQDEIDFILITSRQYYFQIKEDLIKKGINDKKIYLLEDYIRFLLFDSCSFKYKLSLVLLIRNESEYIEEWIEYHRIIGVEHFYIYDDESTDELCDKLQYYIDTGVVTYILWSNADQCGAYNHAIQNFKWDNKYMGFIDTDEFIVSVEHRMLLEVIEEIIEQYEKNPYRKHYMDHCGGIGINWRMYGTSNHKNHQDGLVLENYVYRADDRYYENIHIKSIVNPRTVICCGVHAMTYIKGFQCISENGSFIPDSFFFDSIGNKLRINHYWCKSEEDLLKKYERGWVPEREKNQDISLSAKRMNDYIIRLRIIQDYWNQEYDPILKEYASLIKECLKQR